MSSKKGYRFLEHTADEYILAYGDNLEEAFENAALAMFDVMTDIETIDPKEADSIEIKAEDETHLLYTWLEHLLLKFDIDGKLYSKFQINKIKRIDNVFFLTATIWGEIYNQNKHPSRTDVKAITYHRMEIVKEKRKTSIKFILDI
jgi:SHS2 domain-containing protein